MAAFGAKYINFAKIKTEPEGAMPTYEAKKQLGELVKAELSVNLASGEIYGDDRLVEKVEEFASGSLAVEVTDMVDETEAEVFGSSYDADTGIVDATSDEIPYGGLGYYKVLMRNGQKKYKTVFYPKVKAAPGSDSANTKSSSITLSSTPISFTIYEPNNGEWRYRQTFNDEAQAKQWIDSKFSAV